MDLAEILIGPAVSLEEMLAEREWRVEEQARQLKTCHTLVMLSANTAGPIKSFPLLLRGVEEGRRLLEARLHLEGISWNLRGDHAHSGGPTAFYAVEAPPAQVKALACTVEETPHLGRLLDIDVLDARGRKWERGQLGYPGRRCLLCGAPAAECGRSRRHSVEELQRETIRRLTEYFCRQFAEKVERAALRAMLYEVSATPKPGLVDRNGCGAHRDMDFFSFVDSAAAIAPFFGRLCLLACRADETEQMLLQNMRTLGMDAEAAMYRATGGVNTHKGLIFSLGLLSAAAGRWFIEILLKGSEERLTAELLCSREKALAEMFLSGLQLAPDTHGCVAREKYRAGGIREEAASGYSSVLRHVMPHLRDREGTLEQRGLWALVELMSTVEDTNVLYRGGREALRLLSQQAVSVLETAPEDLETEMARWDESLSSRGISPGGCADLLAVGYFLHFLETEQQTILQ